MTAESKPWIEPWDVQTSDLSTTPILSDTQWEIYKGLTLAFNQDEWVVFAGCAITAFFDPSKLGLRRDEWQNVLKHSALFVIAKGSERKNVKAHLFVLDEKSIATGTQDFLEFWGADVILFDHAVTADQFVERIRFRLDSKIKFHSGNRTPINLAEKNLAATITRHNELIALHEVSLSRLIPYVYFKKGLLDKELAKVGPIDIVLHSVNPNTPALCIEVDGKTHMDPSQQEKDKAKTDLIKEIGLPLMRILPGDSSRWADMPWDGEYIAYTELIRGWGSRISKDFIREVEINKINKKYEIRSNAIRRQLAVLLFDKPYEGLTLEQARVVDRNDLITEMGVDEYYELLEFAEPDYVWGDQPSDMLAVPQRLEGRMVNPVLQGTWQTGISAHAALRLGSVREIIKSPKFYLSHPHLDEATITENLSRLAFAFICRLADRKLAAPSNQGRRRL